MAEKEVSETGGGLSLKRKRIMVYFIEATEKLLREDGVDGLSIRRIAAEAGYNSATLYNYFADLEHLVLFASVRHLRDYVAELRNRTRTDMDALQIYRIIYQVFGEYSFRFPEIFHNMFFGRYSGALREVLQQYYELFPDELVEQKSFVRSMLSQGNIYERDLAFMESLVSEGFVRPEKKEKTVQLLVRIHQSFLADACALGDKLNVEHYMKDFMEIFDYVMEAAR